MSALPYIVFAVLLIGMLFLTQRNRRRRMVADQERVEKIGFGAEVMTTSGLYGTVVARNDDGTVQLSIAPGVEVKWALAALRDVHSLPDRYRRGAEQPYPPANETDPPHRADPFEEPHRTDPFGEPQRTDPPDDTASPA